ncbi:uncharacterized protein LOC125030437 [Penaeus chinensis]|uniref:uncharacterized protein LOC125030437 n=1 Tax=Penaeus chinensis TaxID=139456 RepID=UPI001FB6244C|nr:uncharacterized protein LOC125030437 [Penaeus chinensis]
MSLASNGVIVVTDRPVVSTDITLDIACHVITGSSGDEATCMAGCKGNAGLTTGYEVLWRRVALQAAQAVQEAGRQAISAWEERAGRRSLLAAGGGWRPGRGGGSGGGGGGSLNSPRWSPFSRLLQVDFRGSLPGRPPGPVRGWATAKGFSRRDEKAPPRLYGRA